MATAKLRRDSTQAPASVLIVGASAAGICTAEALRTRGFEGTITLLGDEQHLPYDRPPLSKQVLSGSWEPERTLLRTPEMLAEKRIDMILGQRATRLDTETQTVTTASGENFTADDIVIATGAAPRTLGWHRDLDGVFVLRSLDDSLRLRAALGVDVQVVVIGDGVLGTEITATARSMGAAVTMIGPQTSPLAAQLGSRVGDVIGELHTERGVNLRPGVGVVGLDDTDGRVSGVTLDTGETLPADVVVVAVGAVPGTAWLAGSALSVDNGVVCDSRCRAADHVYAVGDVARWHHPRLDRLIRLENRTNATTQGTAVAAAITGAGVPYAPIPYFWTDQFDLKFQVYGVVEPIAEFTLLEGDVADRKFVAGYTVAGELVGVVGVKMPKQSRIHGTSLSLAG